MSNYKIKVNANKLKKEILRKQRLLIRNKNKILMGIGQIVTSEITQIISEMGLVDTGRFMGSINYEIDGNMVLIHDGVEYGIYLEFGTGIYGPLKRKITPKNKKALHWEKAGKDYFSKSVRGIKPYAPFQKGMERSVPKIQKFVADFWEKL